MSVDLQKNESKQAIVSEALVCITLMDYQALIVTLEEAAGVLNGKCRISQANEIRQLCLQVSKRAKTITIQNS